MKLSSLLALVALLMSRTWAMSVADIVTFTAPANWKKSSPEQSSPFPTEKHSPTDGRNAELLVTLLPIELVKVFDESSLRALYQRLWSSTVGASGGLPQVMELKVANGSGFYTTHEDPALVGKPPTPPPNWLGWPPIIFIWKLGSPQGRQLAGAKPTHDPPCADDRNEDRPSGKSREPAGRRQGAP